jgi:integrase
MTGHVRKRGDRWEVVLEFGEQAAQRCPACRKLYWIDEDILAACPKCGGELEDVMARRQDLLKTRYATKKPALKALRDTLHDREHGDYVQPDDVTLADYLVATWLPSLAGKDLATNTVQAYTLHVKQRIVPRVGRKPLQQFTRADVRLLAGRLATEPGKRGRVLSPATRRAILTVLRHALGDAVEDGLLKVNPAAGMARPQPQHREMQTWDREQLLAFLEATQDDRLGALWHLLAMTGLRRGEALGLQWPDVDLGAGTLAVQRQRKQAGYTVEEGPTKTGRGRSVRMRAETAAVLKAWKARQNAERLEWGKAWKGDGHVFTRENGEPWHPDRITKLFGQATKTAGAPTIRLHDLRHTFATLSLKAGVHIKVVAECLGHKNEQITLATYSHVTPDLQQASLGLMDTYMAAKQ